MLIRLQRYSGQQQKDRKQFELLQAQAQPLAIRLAENTESLVIDAPLQSYRWMLEEFRVSLHAQALGTALPVSVKRLQEQWQKVLQWDRENPQ